MFQFTRKEKVRDKLTFDHEPELPPFDFPSKHVKNLTQSMKNLQRTKLYGDLQQCLNAQFYGSVSGHVRLFRF